MKKILALAAFLAAVAPAIAADNIPVTVGSGTPIRSTDTSAGATGAGPYVNWYTLSTSGAAGTAPVVLYGTAGVPAANPLTVQGIATMTPLLVTATISGTPTVTANQGTAGGAAWLVTGTGGTFPATQSGNWTVRNTGNAGAIYDGVIGAATAPPNMTVGGGVFNSSPITLTTGQSAALQFDANGFLKVNTAAGAAAGGTSSNFGSAFPTPGTAIGVQSGANMIAWPAKAANTVANTDVAPEVAVANANPNGRVTSANSSPVVSSSAPTTYHVIWPANITGILVSTGVHTLMSCQMSNNSATAAYLKIYNKATAPTTGTDTPIVTAIIPGPAAGGGGSNIQFGPGGLAISLGLGVAVTTGITDADTGVPTVSTYAINCQYD